MERMNLVLQLVLLCGLFCEGSCFYPGLENVALRGKATQSSVYSNEDGLHLGNAINGIDGNHNSNYFLGSCTHTAIENNPWWRVDLLDVYRISRIVITNRGDGGSERLNGAEIRIGNFLTNNGNQNPKCGTVTPAKQTMEFQCNSMIGRYVNVYLPGNQKYLHLCEVEVYGTLV
ncbi:fucolectin-like [Latimeria chalumnae]|uniref:fucolectin-like n=1 Tax=Latimeria chalumnae TaxID=7897 RepID=UPI00313C9956